MHLSCRCHLYLKMSCQSAVQHNSDHYAGHLGKWGGQADTYGSHNRAEDEHSWDIQDTLSHDREYERRLFSPCRLEEGINQVREGGKRCRKGDDL